jgi:hypothetical protein
MFLTDIAALSIERNKKVVVGLSGFATNEASILLLLLPSDEGLWVRLKRRFFLFQPGLLYCTMFLSFVGCCVSEVGCWVSVVDC